MAARIFINYRREDATATAGRLHDRLGQSFGRKTLFMDVDHIPPGVDFVTHLNNQVAACDVFIAIIGPNWLDARNEKGDRRLDAPDDFVAIEIEAALARDIRVIPVLVDGVQMPKVSDLPKSLKPLVRRQAIDLRHTHFGRDAEALIEKISEAFGDKPVTVGRWRAAAGVLVALLFLGWISLFAIGIPITLPWTVQPDKQVQPGREHLAAAKAEEERKAKAEAEAAARRKAEEAEQQLTAALKAEQERRAKAEAVLKAEQERRAKAEAVLKAEEDRKAKAEAEARAKAEQAEKERLAAANAEEERPKQSQAEARTRLSSLVSPSKTEIDNRDYDRAVASASEAMRHDPRSPQAFFYRGNAYARKGDNDRAIADYSEAIRLNPNDAIAFSNRSIAYRKKNDDDRA